MPIDKDAMKRDMNGIIDDQPISCSFGSVQFRATVGETRRSDDVQAEGILNEADLEIMAVIDDFGGSANLPNVRQVLTVDGMKYHVVERVIEPFNTTVHFVLRRV